MGCHQAKELWLAMVADTKGHLKTEWDMGKAMFTMIRDVQVQIGQKIN